MGMSYELYWFGDVWLVEAYRKAERLRQERINEIAWLQGVYESMAIKSTIGNAFLSKGSVPNRYPEKPFDFANDDKQENDEENDVAFAKLYMNNMVRAGKNWGKGR